MSAGIQHGRWMVFILRDVADLCGSFKVGSAHYVVIGLYVKMCLTRVSLFTLSNIHSFIHWLTELQVESCGLFI